MQHGRSGATPSQDSLPSALLRGRPVTEAHEGHAVTEPCLCSSGTAGGPHCPPPRSGAPQAGAGGEGQGCSSQVLHIQSNGGFLSLSPAPFEPPENTQSCPPPPHLCQVRPVSEHASEVRGSAFLRHPGVSQETVCGRAAPATPSSVSCAARSAGGCRSGSPLSSSSLRLLTPNRVAPPHTPGLVADRRGWGWGTLRPPFSPQVRYRGRGLRGAHAAPPPLQAARRGPAPPRPPLF